MSFTQTLWCGGAMGICKADRCVTAAPSQEQIQQRTAFSGFPQSCVKLTHFLPYPPFIKKYLKFFHHIFLINNSCSKSVSPLVYLESSCSMKDEALWGRKRTRFSLIWILTNVCMPHFLLHLIPHCPPWPRSKTEICWCWSICWNTDTQTHYERNQQSQGIQTEHSREDNNQKLSLLPRKIIQR